MINSHDILETINMIDNENLDVRTITMGISLLDCIDSDCDKACDKIYDKICRYAGRLVQTGEDISKEYGIPIINKRISVTPIAMIAGACPGADPIRYAKALAEDLDFRADIYGRSQSETVYRSASGASDYDLGGFTTANIALGFDFGPEKQFSLLAEVLNLFDKRYQYNSAILEPGLHANVKLSYRF